MESQMEQIIKIKQFLDSSGKIKQLPQKQKTRCAVLEYLAGKFEPGRTYSEREVNAICSRWHTFDDYFLLRRELVDEGLMCRKRDGSSYWKAEPETRKGDSAMNREFHSIDRDSWGRAPYFYYFTKMLPTGYSLTVDVDITNTYNRIKKDGRKFFPAYLYLASRLITRQQEFRIAECDGRLGYYEVLHPSYATFHEDDKTMSCMWTEYASDFETFYGNYAEDQKKYAGNHGILAKTEIPDNNYMIGMLPWTQFTSYNPIPFAGGSSYFPVLQGGKFFEKDGRKMMPFSVTVHHAVADGYHVGLFLQRFQEGMLHPETWMETNLA
jgi:chloramphenicol O-acetyltransferase